MGEILNFPVPFNAIDAVKKQPFFRHYKALRARYEKALAAISGRPDSPDDPIIKYYSDFGFHSVEIGDLTIAAFNTRREAVIFLAENYFKEV